MPERDASTQSQEQCQSAVSRAMPWPKPGSNAEEQSLHQPRGQSPLQSRNAIWECNLGEQCGRPMSEANLGRQSKRPIRCANPREQSETPIQEDKQKTNVGGQSKRPIRQSNPGGQSPALFLGVFRAPIQQSNPKHQF